MDARPPAVFCGQCGTRRDEFSVNFCRVCGAPFNAAPSSVDASSPEARLLAQKAGFGMRFGAYLLDAVATVVVFFLAAVLFGAFIGLTRARELEPLGVVVAEVAGVLYFLILWSAYGKGQTLGMRAVGIRVIRTDGSYLSVPRAFLRYIGWTVSSLVFGLGFLWVIWDRDKQGWHDKIAGTYVVRTA